MTEKWTEHELHVYRWRICYVMDCSYEECLMTEAAIYECFDELCREVL